VNIQNATMISEKSVVEANFRYTALEALCYGIRLANRKAMGITELRFGLFVLLGLIIVMSGIIQRGFQGLFAVLWNLIASVWFAKRSADKYGEVRLKASRGDVVYSDAFGELKLLWADVKDIKPNFLGVRIHFGDEGKFLISQRGFQNPSTSIAQLIAWKKDFSLGANRM